MCMKEHHQEQEDREKFVEEFTVRRDEREEALTGNRIWKQRLVDVGVRNVGQRRRGVRVGTVEGAKGRRRYRVVYMRMTGMGWVRRRRSTRRGRRGGLA